MKRVWFAKTLEAIPGCPRDWYMAVKAPGVGLGHVALGREDRILNDRRRVMK